MLAKLAEKHSSGSFCVYAYGKTVQTDECAHSYPCGVCKIHNKQTYYLKGLANSETGIGGEFDSQFHLDGYKDEKPIFR